MRKNLKRATAVCENGWTSRACWFAGTIFAVVGTIAATANTNLGLGAMNWLLAAIVTMLAGTTNCIPHAIGLYLHSIEVHKNNDD